MPVHILYNIIARVNQRIYAKLRHFLSGARDKRSAALLSEYRVSYANAAEYLLRRHNSAQDILKDYN